VLEYLWESLEIPHKGFPIDATRISYDIANAVKVMHSKNIVNLDLKVDNIGRSRDGTIKLFDFGCSGEPGDQVIGATLEFCHLEHVAAIRSNTIMQASFVMDLYAYACIDGLLRGVQTPGFVDAGSLDIAINILREKNIGLENATAMWHYAMLSKMDQILPDEFWKLPFFNDMITEDFDSTSISNVGGSQNDSPDLCTAVDVVTVPPSTAVDVAPSTAVDVALSTAVDVAPSTAVDVAPSTAVDVAPSTAVDVAPSTAVDVAPSTAVNIATVPPSTTVDIATVPPSTSQAINMAIALPKAGEKRHRKAKDEKKKAKKKLEKDANAQ